MAGRVITKNADGKIIATTRSDQFRPVIDIVRKLGKLDKLLLSPRCASFDQADDIRKGLYRSARYYCSCGKMMCTRQHSNIDGCPAGGQRISCAAEVVNVTDPATGRRVYAVQFRLHDKREAMRSVIEKYGPDRSKWPYDPLAKKLKEARNG